MSVHVCAPAPEVVSLVRQRCHSCGVPRRMVVQMFEWYSAEVTCLRCGDRWSEGERRERPFARGWRKRSIRQAWGALRRYRLARVPS